MTGMSVAGFLSRHGRPSPLAGMCAALVLGAWAITALAAPSAWAQSPRSRTRRLIANVEFQAADGGYAVQSNFLLAELRRSRQDLFAGRTIHTLRPAGDGFRIALKKVLLLNNDEPIDNLTFLV